MFEPYVIEENGRNGEKGYPLYARMLKDRIIMVIGEVEENMSAAVCSQLLYLEQQDPQAPIFMYINSPGGSVTAGLAIYDTMNFVSCPVYTIAMGEAMSMGSFLLSAGTKSFSLPNTSLMYHSISSGFHGTVQDYEINFKEVQRLQDLLLGILYKKVKEEFKQEFLNKIERDLYLTANEAVKYGLIDCVITTKDDARNFLGV